MKKRRPLFEYEITETGTYSKRWWIKARSQKEAWEKRHDLECPDVEFYPSDDECYDEEE